MKKPKPKLEWFRLDRDKEGSEIRGFPPGTTTNDLFKLGYTGVCGPFPTDKAAFDALSDSLPEEHRQPPTRCQHCRCYINFNYMNYLALISHQSCFTCNHWLEVIERYKSGDLLVIDGTTYHDAGRSSEPRRSFLGFGGREFQIQTQDGKIIRTNNLWCGGEIPERWRPQLPDNAKFLDGKHWVEVAGTRFLADK